MTIEELPKNYIEIQQDQFITLWKNQSHCKYYFSLNRPSGGLYETICNYQTIDKISTGNIRRFIRKADYLRFIRSNLYKVL